MVKSLFLFVLLIGSFGVNAKLFKEIGKVAKASFIPDNSPLDFEYDVLYYIPEKLRNKNNLNTLVFLHGGGRSTSTRAGSWRVVEGYSGDLVKIADELGVVLVMPSGSGINWGSHLLNYLKELNSVIRAELPVNPDKIGLSGHSMGAMGITRSFQWLTDEYAFFMPVAGGMDPKYAIEEYLLTNFNTTYHHLQGLEDHFQVFVERCQHQEAQMDKIEKRLGKESGLTIEYYNGAHNYPMKLWTKRLGEAFKTSKRDLYQKELSGVFYHQDEVVTDQWSNGNPYYKGPRNSYFWLKVQKFKTSKKVVTVKANIENNAVKINISEGVKKLRILLSEKNIDLEKPVKVIVNGKIKSHSVPDLGLDMSAFSAKDPGYHFQSYVDIAL